MCPLNNPADLGEEFEMSQPKCSKEKGENTSSWHHARISTALIAAPNHRLPSTPRTTSPSPVPLLQQTARAAHNPSVVMVLLRTWRRKSVLMIINNKVNKEKEQEEQVVEVFPAKIAILCSKTTRRGEITPSPSVNTLLHQNALCV